MIATATTARNIRLNVEPIITSQTGMAYQVEYHIATPRFQSINQCWVYVCRALSFSLYCTPYNVRRTLALPSK